MSQYHVYHIGAVESPFSHKMAFDITLTHGHYVKQKHASPYQYDTKQQAIEAGERAAEAYKSTGHFPPLH